MLYRMFRVAGIETVDQLCALSGHDLMDLSNFRSVRLTDARIGLMRLGRTLRGDSVVGVQRALKQLYGHDLSESVRAQRRLGVGSPIV
jgi:DNA-directed RNA polymerase alpha subunit